MLMIMFSMAGVPPFVGFWAKLVVLGSVLDAGLVWLAAVGVLFSVIGAFYYLRIVWFMYFAEPDRREPLAAAPDMRIAHQRERARAPRARRVPRSLDRSLRSRARRLSRL